MDSAPGHLSSLLVVFHCLHFCRVFIPSPCTTRPLTPRFFNLSIKLHRRVAWNPTEAAFCSTKKTPLILPAIITGQYPFPCLIPPSAKYKWHVNFIFTLELNFSTLVSPFDNTWRRMSGLLQHILRGFTFKDASNHLKAWNLPHTLLFCFYIHSPGSRVFLDSSSRTILRLWPSR